MNVLDITNPVLNAQILNDSFRAMSAEEFEKTVASTLDRGKQFAQTDDTAYCASLSENDATMYACHARTFLKALEELKTGPRHQIIRAQILARAIAWWQVLSTFKTMHGKQS